MVFFRHALQVCTIACVSIAIDGHLLLAVNVEDFRNLANKFLAKDLADRLTNLVSEISLRRRKENQQIENILANKEIPIKEAARTNQQPTDASVATASAVTTEYNHYKPKRFNTVKNADSKELKQVIYNTPPGPVSVRDEIEDLLQNINEGNLDNGTKEVYTPEGIDYNIDSKEATRPLNVINMSRDHNKIDYTETKLGEWKYNHDISIEPPAIKNSKTGNANRDINDEGSIDYDQAKRELNVQYVDETRLLGRHKKDDSHTFEEHMLGEKNEINHENTPPKQNDTAISHDIKEVKKDPKKTNMPLNHFLKDITEVEQDKSEKKETHQKPPLMQPIESNDMYEKYAVGSSIKSNNKKGVNDQSVEDGKEKHYRETKQMQNDDNDKNVDNQSGNIEQSILRNKKKYQNFKVPENREENSKEVTPEQISTHRLHPYDEDKLESDTSEPDVSKIKSNKKVKQPVHDVTSTEEAKEKSKERKAYYDPHISKEETDTHEKFELGSDNKKNNKRKPKQQAEDSDKINELIKKEIKIDKDDELHIQDNNNKSYKAPLLLRNKYFKDSEYCKQNPSSRMCREEELTTKIALRESTEVSRPLPVKGKKESFSDHVFSFKMKDHQVNYDLIKNTHKRRPQKKIEENDMYDKYELGPETKNDDDRKQKFRKQKENRDIKIMDGKNKLNYQGRGKNKSANSEELPIKSKRKPQKKIEENDMYDKYELGRETDNDDKGKRKQKHNDEIKTTYAKNTFNYQGRNKDKIEEHDMYDKYELGRETDSDGKINRKKKVDRDDTKIIHEQNKFNYQGRYKDKFANNEEMLIKSRKKPQKIIKENIKHDISRQSKNDDNSNRKQKENRDDKKTMNNAKKINDHGSIESANNEEMPITSKDTYKNIEDTDTTTKHTKTKKGQGQIEKVPIAGYADDPQPDFKEVNPESIQAATESLLDSEEPKGYGRPTKKFTMRGTMLPKRDFYKLSSPNYYKDLPRIVEKYDFEEPIPEQDRVRDKVRYLKREPSRVNRKLKLPQFEKT